jgi:hypothetical protein
VRRIVTRVLFLAASTLAFPGSASAQPAASDADRTTARALAHEGYEAQKQQQYALAADRFARAEALVHAPTLLLGLARAQVGLGKLVEANETYRRILREPLAPGAPAPFAAAVKSAEHEDVDVAARLAWVTLVVKGPSSAVVVLDGVEVPAAALDVRLAANPGAHAVRAAAEGFFPADQSFALSEAGEQRIVLTLRARPVIAAAPVPVPAVAAPAPAPVSPPERTSSAQTKVGIAALGVGGAGLVVAGISGVMVLTRHASLDDACPSGHCSPAYAGQLDTYRTLANVSTVAAIVGGAGAVTGIVLLLTAPRSTEAPSKEARSTEVNVYAGPMSAGIAGRF